MGQTGLTQCTYIQSNTPCPLSRWRVAMFTFILTIGTSLSGCDRSAPNGRIRVKNDSEDSSYNVVQVSAGGASYSLKPGESAILPKGSTMIYFSRAYKEYTRSYKVECPPLKESESGITVKLIDVHLNRMRGGCKTVYARKG